MLRRAASLCLAVLLILSVFSGCGKTPDETTAPTESPYSGEVPNVVNGVYATCENYDFTIYKGPATQPKFEFYLLCEEALPSDATVVLDDVEADCVIEIADCTPGYQTVNREIYMFLQNPDMDWAAYYAERERLAGEVARLVELINSAQATKEELAEADLAYSAFLQQYNDEMDAYNESKQKPQWHLYRVTVRVRTAPKREQLKSLTLNAGEMSRQIPLKNVWVDPQPISGTGHSIPGVTQLRSLELPPNFVDESGIPRVDESKYYSGGDRAAQIPWKSGTQRKMVYFKATADINLKNVYSHGDNDQIKVEYAQVVVVSSRGTAISSRWEPGTDFMIRKGESVAMAIYWSDPATEQANYAMNAIFVVEYEVNGKIWKLAYDFVLSHSLLSTCELYLWVFEQMDFESFYREYANKLEGYVPFSGVFG